MRIDGGRWTIGQLMALRLIVYRRTAVVLIRKDLRGFGNLGGLGWRGALTCDARSSGRLVFERIDVLQQRLQLGAPTVDAAFDGAHRQPGDIGDLFVRELLDIP